MNGKRGYFGRSDDALDRKAGAELMRVEMIAQERRRQRRVDEAGGDEIDPGPARHNRHVATFFFPPTHSSRLLWLTR